MDAPGETRHTAKQLRRNLSLPEGLLWRAIKGRQLAGMHFRKQHPLGPYILDFYCDAAKLCIEIDGRAHEADGRPQRDERRDAWLLNHGVRTLRIRAADVLGDLEAVVRTIAAAAS